MKKFNFIPLFGLLTTWGFAQQTLTDIHINFRDTPTSFKSQSSGNRELVADWYNYGQTLYDFGGDVSYFRNNIFPDSTVVVGFNDGNGGTVLGSVYKHSIGQVFDPTSFYFEASEPAQISVLEDVGYTVDSIAIPYRYFRYQNSAPDTVVVQFYIEPAINVVPQAVFDTTISYANVDYDLDTKLGAGAIETFTYLLTDADVATENANFIQYPVGINVPAGKKVAATITYFPGNSFNVGDTIDAYFEPAPTNPVNSFIVYEYADNDQEYDQYFYNNEIVVVSDTRYDINNYGWPAQYIPGTAWIGVIFHADMFFHITFDNEATTLNEKESIQNISIYPNPSGGIINFTAKDKIISAKVVDLSGRIIMNQKSSNVTSIDLGNIESGSYILQLENTKGEVINKKFRKE